MSESSGSDLMKGPGPVRPDMAVDLVEFNILGGEKRSLSRREQRVVADQLCRPMCLMLDRS